MNTWGNSIPGSGCSMCKRHEAGSSWCVWRPAWKPLRLRYLEKRMNTRMRSNMQRRNQISYKLWWRQWVLSEWHRALESFKERRTFFFLLFFRRGEHDLAYMFKGSSRLLCGERIVGGQLWKQENKLVIEIVQVRQLAPSTDIWRHTYIYIYIYMSVCLFILI